MPRRPAYGLSDPAAVSRQLLSSTGRACAYLVHHPATQQRTGIAIRVCDGVVEEDFRANPNLDSARGFWVCAGSPVGRNPGNRSDVVSDCSRSRDGR